MFKTRLTELLGVKYPIIGGAMAPKLTDGKFAAAVSNAGGFGLIAGVSWNTKEELREQIRICRSHTDKPFGINIALISRDPELINSAMDCVIEEEVKFVETAAQNPAPYIERLKKAGITVLHKCATVRQAQNAERNGADVVSLVGYEAAGHTGMIDTPHSILIPWAVETLKVPVVASGGVADGRAFVAALSLGAIGVQIGTRFMATQECPIHPKFKEWLVRSEVTDTCFVERSIGRAYRVIRNKDVDDLLKEEAKGDTKIEDILHIISGNRSRMALYEADLDAGITACGQSVGLIHDIPTVKEVVDRIISQAEEIVNRLHSS